MRLTVQARKQQSTTQKTLSLIRLISGRLFAKHQATTLLDVSLTFKWQFASDGSKQTRAVHNDHLKKFANSAALPHNGRLTDPATETATDPVINSA